MKRTLIFAVALLLVSPAVLADKPDPEVPNPPLQVKEYNVDADGHIAVHEQGTVGIKNAENEQFDVNVTGGSINAQVTGGSIDANVTGGTVTVDNTNANPVPVSVRNFPNTQGVWIDGGRQDAVNRAYYDFWNLQQGSKDMERHDFSVGRIMATTIYVSDGDNEDAIYFYSDSLAPLGENELIVIDDTAGQSPDHILTFPYPVALDGFRIECHNTTYRCFVQITVLGFAP
jgi:hypothetical protein